MHRVAAIGITLLFSHSTLAFADARRGSEAFARGNYSAANREWREAAKGGDADAMLGVGVLYDTGHGEPQDFAQALSWYRRAAETGNVRAMFNVGAMYDNGRGTRVNRPEAIKWYAMSAVRGNGRAAYAAATIYRDGDGVPRNTEAAVKYFRIAAAAGINAARLNLASLGQGIQSPSSDAVTGLLHPPDTASKGPEGIAAKAKRPHAAQIVTIDAATAKVEPPPPPAVSPAVPVQVPDDAMASAKPSAAAQSATADGAAAKVEPPPPPVVSPTLFEQGVAEAEPPCAPAPESPAPGAPAGTANDNLAVAANNIPVGPIKPPGSSPVQVMPPEAIAAGLERFHKIALQRADMSALLLKQYDGILEEVTQRATEGDEVAQYDTGFAYERGVGVLRDMVRSYVYYMRAALSTDAELKSAALRGAFDVGDQLTDAQQASAADMLAHGTR